MDRLERAFQTVKRETFLPAESQGEAAFDAPLPIGYGQTNSQPSTVRMMLEWLDPQPGERILDVGSGSGWTTALLGLLVSPGGFVYAVEKVPELMMFGANNCRQASVNNTRFCQAGDALGLPEHAPFDRILVSAAARKLPESLVDQLKPGGRLVIPVKHSIFVIDKTLGYELKTTEHPGFAFVPLI